MPTTEVEGGRTVIEDFDPIVSGAINLIGNWIPIVGIICLAAIVRCHEFINDNCTNLESFPFVTNLRLSLKKNLEQENSERPESCCFFHGDVWCRLFVKLWSGVDRWELNVPQR